MFLSNLQKRLIRRFILVSMIDVKNICVFVVLVDIGNNCPSTWVRDHYY